MAQMLLFGLSLFKKICRFDHLIYIFFNFDYFDSLNNTSIHAMVSKSFNKIINRCCLKYRTLLHLTSDTQQGGYFCKTA